MTDSSSPSLLCGNGDCQRPLAGFVAFCPFCGRKQEAVADVKAEAVRRSPPPLPATLPDDPAPQSSAIPSEVPEPASPPPSIAVPDDKAAEMAVAVSRSPRSSTSNGVKPPRNDWPLMLILGALVLGGASWALFLRDGVGGSEADPGTQSVPAPEAVAQDAIPDALPPADHAVGADGGVLQIVTDEFYRRPKKLYPLTESGGVFKPGVFLFLENDTVALCLDSGECMPALHLGREDASRQERYADVARGYRIEIDRGIGVPLAVSSILATGHPAEESEAKIPASTPFINVLHGSEISKALVVTMNLSRFRVEAVAESDAGFARSAKRASDIAAFLSFEPSVRERGAVSALKELPYIEGADWLARSRLVIKPVAGTTDMVGTASGVCEFILRWSEFEGTSLYLVDQQEQVHIEQCTMAQVLRQEKERLATQQMQQQEIASEEGVDGGPTRGGMPANEGAAAPAGVGATQADALAADLVRDGTNALANRNYAEAKALARSALRVSPGNPLASDLLRKAEAAEKRALQDIKIN